MRDPPISILTAMLKRRAGLFHGLPKPVQSRLSICGSKFAELVARAKSALTDRIQLPSSAATDFDQAVDPAAQTDPSASSGQALSILNCRVQLTKQPSTNCPPAIGPALPSGASPGTGTIGAGDAFTVQIVGSIRAASDSDSATVQIQIMDVTDGAHKAKPVYAQSRQWRETGAQLRGNAQTQDTSPVFCHRADLGRLFNKVTTLSDWTTVAHLNLDWLQFPHKGKRALQFSVSVLSGQSGQELAHAECLFACQTAAFGYVDLQENVHRTKSLAVALAFAVSAADNKLYHSEVQLIKDWARANLWGNSKPEPVNRKLEEALDRAVSFFQKGNQLDIHEVCRTTVEIAPVRDRYDILDLCMRVARAKGTVAAEELAVLKYMATWLEVDMDRFHAMIEKLLPVNIHQVKDANIVLGLACDMSKEKTRRQLNKEYGKWNSRVTNADPEIQAQADQMLKLIAEARSQYVG